MKLAAAILVPALSLACVSALADDAKPEGIVIAHGGSQPSVQGAGQRFAGHVRINPLFQRTAPSRLSGGLVTFEPGARTAWHTHPLGQTLIVTSGKGWVRQWGGERRAMAAGDVVLIPAGVKHWHGATSDAEMTHIALQEALDGRNVDWLEQVTDEQYRKE